MITLEQDLEMRVAEVTDLLKRGGMKVPMKVATGGVTDLMITDHMIMLNVKDPMILIREVTDLVILE